MVGGNNFKKSTIEEVTAFKKKTLFYTTFSTKLPIQNYCPHGNLAHSGR